MIANTDTNRRRRRALTMVPAFACRTPHLGECQGSESCSLNEHRLPIVQGESTRQRRAGVIHSGASARSRASWDGPVHGAPRMVCPAVDNPRSALPCAQGQECRCRQRPPPTRPFRHRMSPLDNSTHRRASGKNFFQIDSQTVRPEEPPSFGGVSKGTASIGEQSPRRCHGGGDLVAAGRSK